MALMKPFDRFVNEAALVGKMLTGYAVLEIDLMHCVNSVSHDVNAVLKTMFKVRGEKRRVEIANDLGRELFNKIALVADFDFAIAATHHCREIRNQYAHCVWWDDNTPRLAFGAVENIAQQDAVVTLADLAPDHVTVQFLQQQLNYFEYTDDFLIWLIRDSLRIQGKQFHPGVQRPAAQAQPALRIP